MLETTTIPIDTILLGDSLVVLKTIPSGSIRCCVTSPPYYALRDYEAEGQIGREATPGEYIERLVMVFSEVKRVLRPDGTFWLNIADTYCKHPQQGAKQKDMLGIPWRLALALQRDGWYLRSNVIWEKGNAMPESVTDRCNPPEKRMLFENTHPAIIDPDTWEIAQKNREQRKRPMKQDEIGLFSGLVICSDCGKRLYHSRGISTAHERENYTCGTYRRFSNRCTAHYIRVVVLEELVLQNLQRVVAYAREDEDEFVRRVIENKLAVQRTEQEQSKRKLEKQRRRITELDAIIQRLYEFTWDAKTTSFLLLIVVYYL